MKIASPGFERPHPNSTLSQSRPLSLIKFSPALTSFLRYSITINFMSELEDNSFRNWKTLLEEYHECYRNNLLAVNLSITETLSPQLALSFWQKTFTSVFKALFLSTNSTLESYNPCEQIHSDPFRDYLESNPHKKKVFRSLLAMDNFYFFDV